MMRKSRRGISEIVSTIILVSTLLLISIVIMFVANNIFSYQTENSEFEQAKNIMINLAEIIEGISGKEGSSGYVNYNLPLPFITVHLTCLSIEEET